MSPTVISKEEALAILRDHIDDIIVVLLAGWAEWKELQKDNPEKTATKGARTRATWVSDAMAAKARELFDPKPGVHVSKKHGFVTVTFDNKLVLRFKKFRGKTLRTSGIPTQQRMLFENQQLHLDGMMVTGVVAGYLLDELEQEQAKLAITCPLKGKNEWDIELEIPGGDVQYIAPPAAPKQPTPGVVVESASASPAEEETKES